MAKGNSWKTRNIRYARQGSEPRKMMKRELRAQPQFTMAQLYIPPFTLRRRYDEEGRCDNIEGIRQFGIRKSHKSW